MDIHGGNLDLIQKKFNINKNEIIDFSDNINPLGVSKLIKENIHNVYDLLNIYPDESYTKLKQSISNYTNTNSNNVLVGNGATELISSLIKSINPKNSLLILPTYSEYEKELNKINSNIEFFEVLEQDDFKLNVSNLLNSITHATDLLVFCNPNNPTGYATPLDDLKIVLNHCVTTNTIVLLDETYVEFSKNSTGATSLINTYNNLFIIRGTSKFFAISGLRLGYALCSNESLLSSVQNQLIPWNVNVVAEYFGQLVFNDTDFISKSINLCNDEYNKFKNYFSNIDKIKMFESDTNFILFKILSDDFDANDLFTFMIKNGILIRNLSHSKGLSNKYFRVCLQLPQHNDKFLNCLSKFLTT